MYKVFVNDLPVIFSKSDSTNDSLANYILTGMSDTEVFVVIGDLYAKLSSGQLNEGICLVDKDLDRLWKVFRSRFVEISAAGGMVYNDEKLLAIYRLGKWDLPKGKLEKGEDIKECAVREVQEECGLKDVVIEKRLPNTYHTYVLDDVDILKTTYWYRMITTDTELIPQIEEDIHEVKWVEKDEVKMIFENTYTSIKELMISVDSRRSAVDK